MDLSLLHQGAAEKFPYYSSLQPHTHSAFEVKNKTPQNGWQSK